MKKHFEITGLEATVKAIAEKILNGTLTITSSSKRRSVKSVNFECEIFLESPPAPGKNLMEKHAAERAVIVESAATTARKAEAAAETSSAFNQYPAGKPPRIPQFKRLKPPPLANVNEEGQPIHLRISPATPPSRPTSSSPSNGFSFDF